MKRWILLLLGLVVSVPAFGAETARVRLYCNSLRLLPGTSGSRTLTVSTDPKFLQVNNELSPLFDPQVYFRLEGGGLPNTLVGEMALDTPEGSDVDGNGYEDFFEVSHSVNETTEGFYTTSSDGGSLSASWTRPAGSATGTLLLTFGTFGTFTHKFELIEYTGTLTYQPQSTSITGTLELTQTQAATNTLSGSVTMVRSSTNRFEHLTLLAGTLAAPNGKALSYPDTTIDRDAPSKTNYFGPITFADGNPATALVDFREWGLSIDDTNDANHNGVPDLSDDPSGVITLPPSLTLVKGAPGQLLLSVTGAQGKTYDLEAKEFLTSPTWSKVTSIASTTDPQPFPLPVPATRTMFWRLRSP